ncbi:trypsin-like serine peptidase [Thiobaca trueperi]|uniref:Trypsin n=1 Tax=Thiobaca trueperi TaxID=127458 RepID=A0A4R3MYL6_9GAMM|nr:trypsin-like serine protease [Thiobaca trueperi]TCT20696.1 trypsin [Thiobaca trueperi]
MRNTLIKSAVMVTALSSVASFAPAVFADGATVQQQGQITTWSVPSQQANAAANSIDYASARAMPLPQANIDVSSHDLATEEEVGSFGSPGSVGGATGNGKQTPVRLVPKEQLNLNSLEVDESLDLGGVAPSEYGTGNLPFTTSRVDLVSSQNVSKLYPYSPAGKLFFKIGSSNYICSASLIKRGIAVTAAHCVSDFGKKKFFTSFSFVPAYYDGVAPYGAWSVTKVHVMASYFNGTDPCASGAKGVVCKNDIAVLQLTPKSGAYPGTQTGWYGYGWNGYGFTGSGFTVGKIALINQLGYPRSHDGGRRMQRTDSEGYISGSSNVNNTIWGSRQTGGSSGGPELVNLGISAVLSDGVTLGSEAGFNRVIGTTSWGYTNQAVKLQGASPFLSTNIVPLMNLACASNNPRCK